MSGAKYVIVTPVRNEAAKIGGTIESVLGQSLLPQRWVIISDGSTDDTDDIVTKYAASHPFIVFVRREPDPSRNFGSKVRAIRAGLDRFTGAEYDFIGNLDGDITFPNDYFATLFERFAADPRLGLAGGRICEEIGGTWVPQVISPASSVSGAVQMFRRECFEQIGGYLPLPLGGIDAVAEGMARMHGWRVQTFSDLQVHHHGRVGTAGRSVLGSFRAKGRREYNIGYHPLFGILRSISRMRAAPFVIGGLWYAAGFYGAMLRREPPAVPAEYIRFLRREQLRRLMGIPPGR